MTRMTNLTPQHFDWTVRDGIATIRLTRPERKNPLTFESYAELRDTFRALPYATDVDVVVLASNGGNFCSGGDVHEIIGPLVKMEMPELLAFTRMTGDLVKAMLGCHKPIIAAADGMQKRRHAVRVGRVEARAFGDDLARDAALPAFDRDLEGIAFFIVGLHMRIVHQRDNLRVVQQHVGDGFLRPRDRDQQRGGAVFGFLVAARAGLEQRGDQLRLALFTGAVHKIPAVDGIAGPIAAVTGQQFGHLRLAEIDGVVQRQRLGVVFFAGARVGLVRDQHFGHIGQVAARAKMQGGVAVLVVAVGVEPGFQRGPVHIGRAVDQGAGVV